MKQMLAAFTALAVIAAPASAAAVVGRPAPNFKAADVNGKAVSLSDFRGKTVVLEWNNPECPFVKKHYGAGNMQKQQRAATGSGVVWLTVNSSAAGKQGHVDAAAAKAIIARQGGAQTAYLLDAAGEVGRAYGAKTTPHMFVIDGRGTLRYNGAIDSIASADQADITEATQYVEQALADLAVGREVATSTTQPYGCSVKY